MKRFFARKSELTPEDCCQGREDILDRSMLDWKSPQGSLWVEFPNEEIQRDNVEVVWPQILGEW